VSFSAGSSRKRACYPTRCSTRARSPRC
jgi:hypothetical protein